jgi:hypothetical protein
LGHNLTSTVSVLRQWKTLASAKPWALRQCQIKCKNVVVGLRQIISAKAFQCQVEIFLFEQFVQVLYNYYINRR